MYIIVYNTIKINSKIDALHYYLNNCQQKYHHKDKAFQRSQYQNLLPLLKCDTDHKRFFYNITHLLTNQCGQ